MCHGHIFPFLRENTAPDWQLNSVFWVVYLSVCVCVCVCFQVAGWSSLWILGEAADWWCVQVSAGYQKLCKLHPTPPGWATWLFYCSCCCLPKAVIHNIKVLHSQSCLSKSTLLLPAKFTPNSKNTNYAVLNYGAPRSWKIII